MMHFDGSLIFLDDHDKMWVVRAGPALDICRTPSSFCSGGFEDGCAWWSVDGCDIMGRI